MSTEKTFRDRLTTVDEDGHRKWIYAKKPKGKLNTYRNIVTAILLTLMAIGPFVEFKGHPLVLLDVLHRKFIIFGKVFWPQDFYLIVFIFLTALVFLILFTVIFGRIFCGWFCPQTIFMEGVFRKIEYLIEGDYMKQKALDNMPWNAEKITKKTLKHSVFLLISVLISNLLLAYLIGKEELFKIIFEPISEHFVGFLMLVGFSAAFYFVFAKMRENVCSMACPYGRLQGVLLDKKSIVVAYDFVRGEPRGKVHKGEDRTIGDCIDCKQCVYVCPAGIDIRNGTQLECINCTACIDACDEIMEKVQKPKGLIRFASLDQIEKGVKFKWNTRIIAYSFVLFLMLVAVGVMFMDRGKLDATLMRAQGTLYIKLDNDIYRNIYNIKVINKSQQDIDLVIALEELDGKITMIGGQQFLLLPKEGLAEAVFFVDLNKNQLEGIKTTVKFQLIDKKTGKVMETVKTNFIGPY